MSVAFTVNRSDVAAITAAAVTVGLTLNLSSDSAVTYTASVNPITLNVAGAVGPPGAGIAPGGATGEVLVKAGPADYDTGWLALGTASTADVGTTPGTVTAGDDARLGRVVQLQVTDPTVVLTAGDGKAFLLVPPALATHMLTSAHAGVVTPSGAGAVTVQIANRSVGVDVLSVPITVDVGESTSYTAATPPVIDPVQATMTLGHMLSIDVDDAGTGAAGLIIVLTFSP